MGESMTRGMPVRVGDRVRPPGFRETRVRDYERQLEAGDPDLPPTVQQHLAWRRAEAARRRRIPLADAMRACDEIRRAADRAGLESAVCGSVARRLEHVGDLDIAIILRDPDDRHHWTALRASAAPLAVDLRCAPIASRGALLAILSGPAEWSEALKVIATDAGYDLTGNRLHRDGVLIETPTEAELLAILGLPWISHEARSEPGHHVARLRALRAEQLSRQSSG
jgi:DNA polymerase/3'-5' exonuclease PolX